MISVPKALCAALAAALLAAAAPATAGETFPPEQVARGKKVYKETCRICHGADMVTSGGVAFDLRKFPEGQRDRFVNSVMNGKNNRMPPWKDVLSQDEIDSLYAYVMGSKT